MSAKETAKSKKPPVYNLLAVYTGRRVSEDGRKVYQRFENPEGEERLFSGIRGVRIGYTYKCGEGFISSRPERADVERIENLEWDAADALVDARNAKRRAEKKFEDMRRKPFTAVVDALVPIVRGLGYFEIRALVESLADEAQRKAKKKR